MQRIEVSTAGEEDHRELAAIYVAAFAEVAPEEKWTPDHAAALVAYFAASPCGVVIVAKERGRIVGGAAGIVQPWWNGPKLTQGELFVRPQAARRGIGAGLLRALVASAQERFGAIQVEGVVQEGTFLARWYQRLGLARSDLALYHGPVASLMERSSR